MSAPFQESGPIGIWELWAAQIFCSARTTAGWGSLLALAACAVWAIWKSPARESPRAAPLFYGVAHVQVLFFLLMVTLEKLEPIPVLGLLSRETHLVFFNLFLTQGLLELSINLGLNLALVGAVSLFLRARPRPSLPSVLGTGIVIINFLVLAAFMLKVYTRGPA